MSPQGKQAASFVLRSLLVELFFQSSFFYKQPAILESHTFQTAFYRNFTLSFLHKAYFKKVILNFSRPCVAIIEDQNIPYFYFQKAMLVHGFEIIFYFATLVL